MEEPGTKMSSGSCPRCGQRHPLASCPYGNAGTLSMDPQPPALSDLEAGSTVGEYRVTGLLGEGGMGKVYAGIHPLIGRKVAIKLISRALSGNDEAAARFLQEARAATALRHRNIVDVFAFGKLPDGRLYQVMELLEGESLRRVLERRGGLPLPLTRAILRAILSALDAAHRGGIIHRDIKPDNVFVTGALDGPPEELEVRILDFGLAKQQTQAPGERAVVTRSGFPMGTPAYMSPEQCRGTGSIDARSDLYAAGVVLYEMLTGRLPFESDAAVEVMTMQIGEPVPRPSTVQPVPAALEEVVMRALAKQPDDRYESASQMLAAFEAAAQATPDWRPRGGRPTRPSPRVAAARAAAVSMKTPVLRARRSKWWLLVLGAGAAAAGVVVLKPREQPPTPVVAPITSPPPAVEPPPPPPHPTSATVRVSLQPPGRIYLDGKLAGTGAEATIPDVPFGPHLLRTEAPGHVVEQRTITVTEPLDVAFVLKRHRPARKSPPRHTRPGHQETDLEAPINPYRR
jgi:serine/threonine protein kinase